MDELQRRRDQKELEALAQLIAERARRAPKVDEGAFERWRSGSNKPLTWFYQNSKRGIACENYGKGPDCYTQAIQAAGKPLRNTQTEEALAIAIETLNAIALLVRFGGLRPSDSAVFGDQKTREESRLCAWGVVCDLAVTLTRLRAFGAIAGPTPAERRHIKQAREEWEAPTP